ncbi:DNA polymerase III subunit delta [Methylomarinum sp. Ch1-1]|uniref:DNA polymerase III subunit delta n=1 Tax=Methylomarinum roseum TaxID=3067653 RepID=A0AAU7NUI6_9GAMM
MRLKLEQLSSALQKSLAPIYLLCGEEPLQIGEAADEIRTFARQAGYSVREVLSVEGNFDWQQLSDEADSLSIFAEKKIIDLRLPTGKPGTDGAKALLAYCERLPADTLLLISCGRLASAAQKSRWFQAIDKAGAVIQVWPLQGPDLVQWLQRRGQKKGMQIVPEALKLLASRIEGNLLAAAQEIEKLYILHGAKPISRQDVEDLVADSARFDVFKLQDSLLAARSNRGVKILNGLKAEGVAEPVVLWALSREARTLLTLKKDLTKGGRKDSVLAKHHIWDKRKSLVSAALTRLTEADLEDILLLCAKADQQIKGQRRGNSWETLYAICLRFCSLPVMAETA